MADWFMGIIDKLTEFILFASYELVLVGGTILVGMYVITKDKKLLTKLVWFWAVWLIARGVLV